MKTPALILILAGALAAIASGLAASSSEVNLPVAPTERVGVYDSRAVAYAYFWSDLGTKVRNQLAAEVKAAKAAGEAAKLDELKGRLKALQQRNHLQVFSTEPADEAMAALAPALSELKRDLGVGRFVSKWDEAALAGVREGDRIDVTERLVARLFSPTPRQRKILDAMLASKPLPIEEARRLAESGKM